MAAPDQKEDCAGSNQTADRQEEDLSMQNGLECADILCDNLVYDRLLLLVGGVSGTPAGPPARTVP